MEKVQEPSNSVRYTPSSETYKICLKSIQFSSASKAVNKRPESVRLLETVARERLVTTQQAGKIIRGFCGNLYEFWRLSMALQLSSESCV
jgi:hypothetical protein